MNDIFKMAEQAYHSLSIPESELKRLYKENAELKNSLNREWVGLTDDDMKTIADLASENDWHDFDVMDATEVKLKEKNCG